LDNLEVISNLLRFRITSLASELMARMNKKIMEEGQPLFDVWMKQESDLIQYTGECYGELMTFDVCMNEHKKGNYGITNGELMGNVIMVYGLGLIEKNLGWYLSNGVVGLDAGKGFGDIKSQYVKMVAPNCDDLIDGFMIDNIYSPIATDYEEYNKTPNYGEHGPVPKL